MSYRILPLALTLSLGLLALAAPTAATDVALGDDTPVASSDIEPSIDPLALPIVPDEDVADPRPHAWDHVVIGPDGRTVDVYFWMGIPECNGLRSVEVTPAATGVRIALMTGDPPGFDPTTTACIEIAQLYVTRVTLDEPLVLNAG